MTDEELIRNLRRLTASYHENSASHELLTKLGRRFEELIGPTPPPPGSIAVRIAVSVSSTGLVSAQAINSDEDDAAIMDSASCVSNYLGFETAQAIITAHIPPRVVPEVSATVEAFDPEATI